MIDREQAAGILRRVNTPDELRRIQLHIDAQVHVRAGFVRLDDGRVVREGGDAEGDVDVDY
jgi:hypothetical protein